MITNYLKKISVYLSCLSLFSISSTAAEEFNSNWSDQRDRVWLGPEYWANPMEDWRLKDGKLECIRPGGGRNVHLLTRRLGAESGTLQLSVVVALSDTSKGGGSAGFHLGIKSELGDYRSSLLRGANRGIKAGITTGGALFIGNPPSKTGDESGHIKEGVRLRLLLQPEGEHYSVKLSAATLDGKGISTVAGRARADQLDGNIALVNNFGPARQQRRKRGQPAPPSLPTRALFTFTDWKLSGTKLVAHEDRAWGPILYAMHSLSRNVMKMTAQMPPVGAKEEQQVKLQTRNGEEWNEMAKADIDALSRTATFKITNWDSTRDTPYRLVYTMVTRGGARTDQTFEGTVRKDPVEEQKVVVAGFTGNTDPAFPNEHLARNVGIHDPDVLLFTGDQIYEGVGGFGIHRSPVDVAVLNYLRKVYLWGWAFRDVMRDRVTLALADDHDVYQGNIWGQGGRGVASMRDHAKGGYAMHPDFVNAVQRTLSSHHPDPFDATPVEQGIGVYYGDMVYGRISFAVIEDRKFKSGPNGKVNTWKGRPDHIRDPKFDVKSIDKPGLVLLGDRQLRFLKHWSADWRGADMKVVCSQTIFCNLANYHGGGQTYIVADLDSNGWPQTGRNKALLEMRKGFAFHYAGDQHLASIVHHGVDAWNDAGYSFCVPSIAAGYPRAWRPDKEGRKVQNRPQGNLPDTGEYLDGLRNRVTVYAVGNPEKVKRRPVLELLHDKASGYGLVRFDKKNRKIEIECWRLLIDASEPKPDDQFPGWPKTIDMQDNYGRAPAAWLPTIEVQGMRDPVIQIINEADGEIVYTLRIKGTSFRPKVFKAGKYTVKVGDQDNNNMKTFKGVSSHESGQTGKLQVKF